MCDIVAKGYVLELKDILRKKHSEQKRNNDPELFLSVDFPLLGVLASTSFSFTFVSVRIRAFAVIAAPIWAPVVPARAGCPPSSVASSERWHCPKEDTRGDETRHGDLPEHNENWGWARSFCNPGRSSNFWAFRQYILSRQLHVSTSLAPCRLAQRKPVVFVAIRALDDKFEGPGVDRWEAGGTQLQKLLGDSATVEAKVISTFTIREQAVFMAKTNVLVQLSGGGSSTMLFLPRGATTVLLAPRSTKDDFVLWGHTAWLRITWVEIKELNDPLDTAVIAPLVTEGLAHYERFSECSDV